MKLLEEIKEMIKEEKRILKEDESTKADRQQIKHSTTPKQPNSSQSEPQTAPQTKPKKDLRPGLNAYHGIVVQSFTEAQNLSGDTGELIKKVTQFALQQMNNGDAEGVFNNTQSKMDPKTISTIVQKAMLVALNHVADIATANSEERGDYNVAAGE